MSNEEVTVAEFAYLLRIAEMYAQEDGRYRKVGAFALDADWLSATARSIKDELVAIGAARTSIEAPPGGTNATSDLARQLFCAARERRAAAVDAPPPHGSRHGLPRQSRAAANSSITQSP